MAAVTSTRKGRQTPTQCFFEPYTKTKGPEAVELYEKSGRKALPWQSLLLSDIMSVNDAGEWVHMKAGYAVPRRNGKNELIIARELWGLINGERILHTAHRATTSTASFERLYELLTACGYTEKSHFTCLRQRGLEVIQMIPDEKQGIEAGAVYFRTRTEKGGLGEGFDLLIIDEAQEYTTAQENAIKYVVSSSVRETGPQTIMCGTPPTPISAGTVFKDLRNKALRGEAEDAYWAEWSTDTMKEPEDVDAWYESNPSLGYAILSERKIRSELSNDKLDHNIQRLGYWTKENLKTEFKAAEWDALKLAKLPQFKSRLFVGIKYSMRATVSLSIALKTADNRFFVETVDNQPTRNGNGWILRFLKEADYQEVVIDGQGGRDSLILELDNAKIKNYRKITVPEVVTANQMLYQAITGEEKELCHMGQPSLRQAVLMCERRAIGTGGGFGYRSITEEVDISLLESMALALWDCKTAKERRKAVARY